MEDIITEKLNMKQHSLAGHDRGIHYEYFNVWNQSPVFSSVQVVAKAISIVWAVKHQLILLWGREDIPRSGYPTTGESKGSSGRSRQAATVGTCQSPGQQQLRDGSDAAGRAPWGSVPTHIVSSPSPPQSTLALFGLDQHFLGQVIITVCVCVYICTHTCYDHIYTLVYRTEKCRCAQLCMCNTKQSLQDNWNFESRRDIKKFSRKLQSL